MKDLAIGWLLLFCSLLIIKFWIIFRVHTQKSDDEERHKVSEVKPAVESILRSSNFTRFDLFGKHEPEGEEDCVVVEESMEADKTVTKDNAGGSNKSTESVMNVDTAKDSKEDDAEASNSGRDLEIYQEEGEEYSNNKNERTSSKATKSTMNVQSSDVDIYATSCFDSYDFHVFEKTYI